MTSTLGRPVIGLTGGIGAGKSAVARMLAALGGEVSDSDRDVGEVLAIPEVVRTLRDWWGDGIVDADGRIDRAEVARRVFADADERRRLEALVHPLVHDRRRIRFADAAAAAKFFVIDAPLLFEAGLDRECDVVWFVDAPIEARRDRVRVHRGWNDAELERRESHQWSIAEKRDRSDVVLENDDTLDALEVRVCDALASLLRDESR